MGEVRARRIVEHREARGGFRSIEELEDVPGLPRGFVEGLRPYLTLEIGD